MLTVLDIGVSNLASVRQAFVRVGCSLRVSADPSEARAAGAIVLPGVGAFGDAMDDLEAKGLVEPIRAHAAAGKPVLGICLGMQLMSGSSEEADDREGLNLVPGRVTRLAPTDPRCRVPNIGWCDVSPERDSVLFAGMAPGTPYYFIHGYHVVCDDPADVSATLRLGGEAFTAAFERDHLFGVQFHPEKSQDAGLDMIDAFCRHVRKLGLME